MVATFAASNAIILLITILSNSKDLPTEKFEGGKHLLLDIVKDLKSVVNDSEHADEYMKVHVERLATLAKSITR